MLILDLESNWKSASGGSSGRSANSLRSMRSGSCSILLLVFDGLFHISTSTIHLHNTTTYLLGLLLFLFPSLFRSRVPELLPSVLKLTRQITFNMAVTEQEACGFKRSGLSARSRRGKLLSLAM